jgi:hypothetical protein
MFKLGCASRVCFKNGILSGLTVAPALAAVHLFALFCKGFQQMPIARF